MSNVNKTVKISESDLVNLIDNIVSEAVEIKKKEWLSEQATKGNKNSILESKLAALEAKINKLTEGK
jgi:hypothetical protein